MVWLWKCFVILLFSPALWAKDAELAAPKFEKALIQVGEKKITVEIAQTNRQLEHGLMHRQKLGADEGMLFIFPTEKTLSFWMKNTLIDLSIGYFNQKKVLVDIQDMSAPSVLSRDLPTYPSKEPAQYALEMNKGWFEKNKVKKGDKFKILKNRQ